MMMVLGSLCNAELLLNLVKLVMKPMLVQSCAILMAPLLFVFGPLQKILIQYETLDMETRLMAKLIEMICTQNVYRPRRRPLELPWMELSWATMEMLEVQVMGEIMTPWGSLMVVIWKLECTVPLTALGVQVK